jgi:AcrR family transcriptional regulator
VEDILAAAKVARRTFYKYFDGKEAVLAAVYDVATSELLRELATGAARARGDVMAAIKHGLDLYLDYHVEHAALLRVLVENAVRSESPLFQRRRRFRDDVARVMDELVRARGDVAHDPLLYLALLSALEGVSLELLASGRTPSVEDVRRAKRVMHTLLERALAVT